MDAQDDEIETMDAQSMPHDSMVTVRLSEPPNLTVDTSTPVREHSHIDGFGEKRQSMPAVIAEEDTHEEPDDSPQITMMDPNGNEVVSPSGSESAVSENEESRRGSESSEASEGGVNWEELEKTEEQEPRNESSEDVSPRSNFN